MNSRDRLEALFRRDRVVVLSGVIGVTALAWIFLLVEAARRSGAADGAGALAMLQIRPWAALDFVLMLLMWAIMMVAMMLPSATPMVLLFAAIGRKQRERGHDIAPTAAFVAGYLLVWTAFSLGATVLQWALERLALLSPMMVASSPRIGGLLLVAAGLYQLTPLKQACLRHCRSPAHFLSAHWRRGPRGALVMGMAHGAYCVGCCWVLMALLFVGGVMNLLWVAGIAFFVLLEKVLRFGVAAGQATGVALAVAGLVVLWQA